MPENTKSENSKDKDKKKKTAATTPDVQRLENLTSGEILRRARTEKKLGLEEVSSSIHIRVAQLRAIEEGHIETLPGMTYAQGFVRSYAGFLKLNAAEVVAKFKSEHAALAQPMPELNIPAPIAENRMPDPIVAGVAAACAVILLILWSIFSGGDDETTVANVDAIPAPPAVESSLSFPDSVVSSDVTAPVETPVAMPAEVPAPASEIQAVPTPPGELALLPQQKPTALPAVEPAASEAMPATSAAAAPVAEVINIRRGRGRVQLKANSDSWVQVKNAAGTVVFEKVLRKGESYSVPNDPGLTLLTSNAGGIDIIADGQTVQSYGKKGEIVRGLSLEAEELKKKRVRVNRY